MLLCVLQRCPYLGCVHPSVVVGLSSVGTLRASSVGTLRASPYPAGCKTVFCVVALGPLMDEASTKRLEGEFQNGTCQ